MRVPARIYATEKLVREMDETVFDQVANVATLPGITMIKAYLAVRSSSSADS